MVEEVIERSEVSGESISAALVSHGPVPRLSLLRRSFDEILAGRVGRFGIIYSSSGQVSRAPLRIALAHYRFLSMIQMGSLGNTCEYMCRQVHGAVS
jgi:hypothetical protein